MIAQCPKYLDAWVPRGLIAFGSDVINAEINSEGLCALRFYLMNGKISSIEEIKNQPKNIVLPRLTEPHAHIDKAFSWKDFPNFLGTYEGALAANLLEQKTRTVEIVIDRAERSLNLALKNGLRAIRTHIDSKWAYAEKSWEAFSEMQSRWQPLIELQFVALVPIEYWSSKEGILFAKKVTEMGGLLGGVVVPPFEKKSVKDSLAKMIQLADDLVCGIDLHIDEAQAFPGAGLKALLDVLDIQNTKVQITCSHLSSMSLLSEALLQRFANRMFNHQLNVVALPFTNAWLLGRNQKSTPFERPFAPILQLQRAGIEVAIGGDNVQDPWFPLGNFDPLELMSFSLSFGQLAPWNRLGLSPFTTSSASIMNLEWDGTFKVGTPADFIVLESQSWAEVLLNTPQRKIMIKGKWLDETSFQS